MRKQEQELKRILKVREDNRKYIESLRVEEERLEVLDQKELEKGHKRRLFLEKKQKALK